MRLSPTKPRREGEQEVQTVSSQEGSVTPVSVSRLLVLGHSALGAGAMGPAFLQAGHHYMNHFPKEAREQLPELWHLLR